MARCWRRWALAVWLWSVALLSSDRCSALSPPRSSARRRRRTTAGPTRDSQWHASDDGRSFGPGAAAAVGTVSTSTARSAGGFYDGPGELSEERRDDERTVASLGNGGGTDEGGGGALDGKEAGGDAPSDTRSVTSDRAYRIEMESYKLDEAGRKNDEAEEDEERRREEEEEVGAPQLLLVRWSWGR